MAFSGTFRSSFSTIWVILLLILGLFSNIGGDSPANTDELELVSSHSYFLDEAYLCGQGITSDGTYFYTSGSVASVYMTGLAKINMSTGRFLLKNLTALPREFTKLGYDHIGDISYYDGYIYAPVEDLEEEYPLVLLFDALTLQYTGISYEMDSTYLPDGIPWCTVDPDNGYLYTSAFNNPDKIVAFNLSDMSFSHVIQLSETIDRVQGGDYFEGKLYVNLDPHGNKKQVKTIDLDTGDVSLLFERDMGGKDIEAEGLTITTDENGNPLFHFTDYDKAVTVFLRTYRMLG